MENTLYEAARRGDIEHVVNITEQLNLLVTPNKNTILHVNLAFGRRPSTRFVEQVLEICPPLLIQVNDYGETPLHVAAKEGFVDIVEILIKHAKAQHGDLECGLTAIKQMLRMTNKSGNTALHEAAWNRNSVDVVKLLIREDPDFPHDYVNNCGETPLYIAASRGSLEVVAEMLEEACASMPNKGPGGMTILHAAVRRNNPDIMRKILEKKSWTKEMDKNGWSLTKETDENGWTPLHYAAYYGFHLIVKLLVKFDASASLIPDKYRKMTALHLAAGQGYFNITHTIIASCPTCIEQVDDRGWNYVHFSMCTITTPFGLRNYHWVNYLLNVEDVKGNTPLLVLASISQYSFDVIKKRVSREFTESTMQSIRDREQQFRQLKSEVVELSKVCDEPYKNGVVRLHYKDRIEVWSSFGENRDMYLVVNALIATVTFTAGLTLPGGYIQEGSNKGTPILIRNSAFQAFVISDTIALVLSVSAVLFNFIWQIHRSKKNLRMIVYAHFFTMYALIAMVVAFVTGTYATLRPSLGLAITNAIVGLSFFSIIVDWSVRSLKAKVTNKVLPLT